MQEFCDRKSAWGTRKEGQVGWESSYTTIWSDGRYKTRWEGYWGLGGWMIIFSRSVRNDLCGPELRVGGRLVWSNGRGR